MEQAGLKVDYLILEQKDYLKELKTKLTEEVNEFLLVDNADKKALTEELADILEVINYLKKDLDISDDELEKAQKKKFDKLGGFDKKIKTNFVEIAEDNEEELSYYLNNLHKYPEIKD
jgi:predicted house-cleaning noncanonical NTP pyrophosphatase (MazG superfamily)